MKSLAIVILNYNTYQLTIRCINSILQEGSNYQIFVVDNFSNNDSLERIKEWCDSINLKNIIINQDCIDNIYSEQIILIQNNSNYGYAKGNNIGISYATKNNHDYILILNNDIEVKTNSISYLLDFYETNNDIGCVGPYLLKDNNIEINCARRRVKWYEFFFLSGIGTKIFPKKIFLKNHYINPNQEKPFAVDLISGSAMLFSTSVLKRINGFDANTFLYYEEAIINEKLKNINLKTYVVPSSKMIHNHAKTTSLIKNNIILKISLDSQLYYLHKYRRYNIVFCYFVMSFHYSTYFIVLLINSCKTLFSNSTLIIKNTFRK